MSTPIPGKKVVNADSTPASTTNTQANEATPKSSSEKARKHAQQSLSIAKKQDTTEHDFNKLSMESTPSKPVRQNSIAMLFGRDSKDDRSELESLDEFKHDPFPEFKRDSFPVQQRGGPFPGFDLEDDPFPDFDRLDLMHNAAGKLMTLLGTDDAQLANEVEDFLTSISDKIDQYYVTTDRAREDSLRKDLTVLTALIYLERFNESQTGDALDVGNYKIAIVLAMMTASKFNNDTKFMNIINGHMANELGLDVDQLNNLEQKFASIMDFNFSYSPWELQSMCKELEVPLNHDLRKTQEEL